MIVLEHELYKAKEVAALLRLNTKTFYGWVHKGRAQVIRTPTGGIRVAKAEVLRLLEERANVAGGEGVDKHLPHE